MLLLFLFFGALNKSFGIGQSVSKKKKSTRNSREHVFYFQAEDESPEAVPYSQTGKYGTLIIAAGAVAILAGAGYFLLRKKK
jgi:LPXTG-motif cell wall-anchored protein